MGQIYKLQSKNDFGKRHEYTHPIHCRQQPIGLMVQARQRKTWQIQPSIDPGISSSCGPSNRSSLLCDLIVLVKNIQEKSQIRLPNKR